MEIRMNREVEYVFGLAETVRGEYLVVSSSGIFYFSLTDSYGFVQNTK